MEKLPKAGYSSDGAGAIRGFMVESKNHQVVFNENDEAVEFTPHTHAASFGVVFEGECELVIDGESKVYWASDVYHVSKSPGILPVRRQITKLLSSLMNRAAFRF